MSDRVKGLWVALEAEMKDEDTIDLQNAIKAMRGVEGVTVRKVKPDDWMIENKIKAKIRQKLFELFQELG